MLYLSVIPLVLFSLIAFWQRNSILFLLAAGSAVIVGFSWYDVDTTARGLGMSMMMWAYAFVCLGHAVVYIFRRQREDE